MGEPGGIGGEEGGDEDEEEEDGSDWSEIDDGCDEEVPWMDTLLHEAALNGK
jgi:hypothetical protein